MECVIGMLGVFKVGVVFFFLGVDLFKNWFEFIFNDVDIWIIVMLLEYLLVLVNENVNRYCIWVDECLLCDGGDLEVLRIKWEGIFVYCIYMFGLMGMFKGIFVEY